MALLMVHKENEDKEQVFLNSFELGMLLSGKKIRLDCGHQCTVGHNFANTLIIASLGGGRVTTYCHSCY